MAEPSVQQLFRQWRGGDAEAGKVMAQKFSDWYYAVTTVRVADRSGREPLERACQSFAQGIISVTRPSTLVDWAHGLLEEELKGIGRGLDAGPARGGDHANALTRNESPTALIKAAVTQLTESQRHLLASAYDLKTPVEEIEALGEDMGGLPFAMLDARYALKRALHESAEIPFAVVPDEADMDRAPIGLYEAGRLASGAEVATLEKWLLTDIDLCKDVAEFAAFVHAMRAGALAEFIQAPTRAAPAAPAAAPEPAPEPTPPAEPTPAPTAEATPEPEEALVDPDDALMDPDDALVDPDDALIDPDDALVDPEDDGLVDPEDEGMDSPEPPAAPPQATVTAPAPSSTMRSILTIAAVLVLGTAILAIGLFFGLRG